MADASGLRKAMRRGRRRPAVLALGPEHRGPRIPKPAIENVSVEAAAAVFKKPVFLVRAELSDVVNDAERGALPRTLPRSSRSPSPKGSAICSPATATTPSPIPPGPIGAPRAAGRPSMARPGAAFVVGGSGGLGSAICRASPRNGTWSPSATAQPPAKAQNAGRRNRPDSPPRPHATLECQASQPPSTSSRRPGRAPRHRHFAGGVPIAQPYVSKITEAQLARSD